MDEILTGRSDKSIHRFSLSPTRQGQDHCFFFPDALLFSNRFKGQRKNSSVNECEFSFTKELESGRSARSGRIGFFRRRVGLIAFRSGFKGQRKNSSVNECEFSFTKELESGRSARSGRIGFFRRRVGLIAFRSGSSSALRGLIEKLEQFFQIILSPFDR